MSHRACAVIDTPAQTLITYLCPSPVQLIDRHGLYKILSDVMYKFMQEKPDPFGGFEESKESFMRVPKRKRALLVVFMTRFVLGKDGSKQWKNFKYDDYVFNYRLFKQYMIMDTAIVTAGTLYDKLPNKDRVSVAKKRKKTGYNPDSGDETPMKIFVLTSDSDSS